MATFLLSGIALGAIAGALTGVISYASDDRELRDLTLWSMGSLSGASWPKLLAILPFGRVLVIAVPRLTASMNGLLLGESEAFRLGIDVERSKRIVVAVTSAAVGAAVAVAVLHDISLAAAWADDFLLLVRGRVAGAGSPREVMTCESLTAAYGCPMIVDAPPRDGTLYVLPHHARQRDAFGRSAAEADREALTLPRPVG